MSTDDEVAISMEPPPRNTTKTPLPESSNIRKSTFGRAILHVEDAHYQELRCSSSLTQSSKKTSIYHSHTINNRIPEHWTKPTTLACWHCCHEFGTPPVPIARSYDTKERSFIVFGNFCSLRCAKGYLVDTPTFESSQQLNMFSKMARDVYGQTDVPIAPPRVALQMFGGPYSIETFREKPISVILLSPPFITSYMVVEERQDVCNASSYSLNSSGTVKGLRRPDKPVPMIHAPRPAPNESPYEIYCQNKKDSVSKTSTSAEGSAGPSAGEIKETRKKKTNADAPGTLNAFMI